MCQVVFNVLNMLNLMIGAPGWLSLSLDVRSAFLQRSCQCHRRVSGDEEDSEGSLRGPWGGGSSPGQFRQMSQQRQEDSLQRLRHKGAENFCH